MDYNVEELKECIEKNKDSFWLRSSGEEIINLILEAPELGVDYLKDILEKELTGEHMFLTLYATPEFIEKAVISLENTEQGYLKEYLIKRSKNENYEKKYKINIEKIILDTNNIDFAKKVLEGNAELATEFFGEDRVEAINWSERQYPIPIPGLDIKSLLVSLKEPEYIKKITSSEKHRAFYTSLTNYIVSTKDPDFIKECISQEIFNTHDDLASLAAATRDKEYIEKTLNEHDFSPSLKLILTGALHRIDSESKPKLTPEQVLKNALQGLSMGKTIQANKIEYIQSIQESTKEEKSKDD